MDILFDAGRNPTTLHMTPPWESDNNQTGRTSLKDKIKDHDGPEALGQLRQQGRPQQEAAS